MPEKTAKGSLTERWLDRMHPGQEGRREERMTGKIIRIENIITNKQTIKELPHEMIDRMTSLG